MTPLPHYEIMDNPITDHLTEEAKNIWIFIGHFQRRSPSLSLYMKRIISLVDGLLLISPGILTDVIALTLVAIVLMIQLQAKRKATLA